MLSKGGTLEPGEVGRRIGNRHAARLERIARRLTECVFTAAFHVPMAKREWVSVAKTLLLNVLHGGRERVLEAGVWQMRDLHLHEVIERTVHVEVQAEVQKVLMVGCGHEHPFG